MALTGQRDTTSLVMLTGWDATELQNRKLKDGVSFAEVIRQIDAAVNALNAEIYQDPLWSSLLSYTDQPEISYRVGGASNMDRYTEYGEGDPERAEETGHMIPLEDWDHNFGWTWKYLKNSRSGQIQKDIRNGMQAVRNRVRLATLGRILKRGDDSGSNKGLGSSGYSPGFATTAGSTNVDFDPPDFAGTSFDNTHEHYVAVAGGYVNSVFEDAADELREHGHEPPFEFLASKSDESTIKGLSEFIPIAKANVVYGTLQDLASLEAGRSGFSYHIGVHGDFAIRIVPGMPQYYGFGYKSYGPNSDMNPLVARIEDGRTRPTVVAMVDPRSGGNAAYPLQRVMLYLELGVGVKDRTAGTPRYVNNATWSDGTAT